MNTSNAGSLGGTIPPSTAETTVSPETASPNPQPARDFERLMSQSIGATSDTPKDAQSPAGVLVPNRAGDPTSPVTTVEMKNPDGQIAGATAGMLTKESLIKPESEDAVVAFGEGFVRHPPFKWNRSPIDEEDPQITAVVSQVETPSESILSTGTGEPSGVRLEVDLGSETELDPELPSELIAKIMSAEIAVPPAPTPVVIEPPSPDGANSSGSSTESGVQMVLRREQLFPPASTETAANPTQVTAENETVLQAAPTEASRTHGSQVKTDAPEPGQGGGAPTRKPSSSRETGPIEARRFESVPDGDRQRDPSVPSFRLESLAAARFAAAAGRQYQMADFESFTRPRHRDTPLEPGGIRAAQRDATMKNNGQENQIAGARVQNMPVSGRDGGLSPNIATVSNDAVRTAGMVRETERRFGASVGEAVSMAMGGQRAGTGVGAQSVSELPAMSSIPLKTSEQLVLSLTREVIQFKSFKSESMAVVLKPDKGTEIFLHLAMRNGSVEVQARIDRGDFASMNSQWAQLQQTMQQQGVKLGSLQESLAQQSNQMGDSSWGHGQHPSQHEGDSADEQFINALDEKLIFGSRKESARRPVRTHSRDTLGSLEAWA